MDNEAPKCVTNYLVDNNISYQLVPQHIHRRNAAERAISTWKDHLIAGICATNPSFPMHLWDRLLKQCNMTLDMMRTSRIHPPLSTYHQLHGHYSYDATPMIPPGTKVVMDEKPKQRGSWDIHGEDGWYIGPALQHYMCYNCYCTILNGHRIVDTKEFFPTVVELPHPSSIGVATQAALDLSQALRNLSPSTPFARYGDGQLRVLHLLENLFRQALPPTLSSPIIFFSNDDFQSLVLTQTKTITSDHIKALKIMNTPPVPSSVPISVYKSLVAPPHPVITPGPLTPPPVLTQEHIKPSPVITQEQNEPSPVITQDFDDDYSFVEPSKPTPIIVRIKDPRPVYIIVRIKDPRPKLTYRNPHAQPHYFIIPTPK